MSQDTGVLDEHSWTNSMSYDCSGGNTSDWEAVYGISAEGSTQEEWDQIAYNGSNIWRFFFHFEERPENLIPDACNNDGFYPPEPSNFRFVVEIADAEDASNLYFSHPDPADGEGESDNDELGLLLNLLGSVGNVYVSAGAAVVDYVMSGSGSSTSVQQDRNGAKYTFDIDVGGGYDDLPHVVDGEPHVADVSLRVNNEYQSDTHCVKYVPEYTFAYRDQGSFSTNCSCTETYVEYRTVSSDILGFACYDVA